MPDMLVACGDEEAGAPFCYTTWIFVTERVVQVSRANTFRNVRFDRPDEMEIDAEIV
jgi:hypothetical protein